MVPVEGVSIDITFDPRVELYRDQWDSRGGAADSVKSDDEFSCDVWISESVMYYSPSSFRRSPDYALSSEKIAEAWIESRILNHLKPGVHAEFEIKWETSRNFWGKESRCGFLVCSYCKGRANGKFEVAGREVRLYERPPARAKDLRVLYSYNLVYRIRSAVLSCHGRCAQTAIIPPSPGSTVAFPRA